MGRSDDELPEIDVVDGADDAVRTDIEYGGDAGRPGRSRGPWVIGSLVVVALTAAVLVSGSDQGSTDEDADPKPTSTALSSTEPVASSTTTARAGSGEFLTGRSEPVLGAPVGASLLWTGLSESGVQWRQLNLDTGWIVELFGLGHDPFNLVPVMDGIVVGTSNGVELISLPPVGPEQGDRVRDGMVLVGPADVRLHEFPQVIRAGANDEVWLVDQVSGSYSDLDITLIDLTGAELASFRSAVAWPMPGTSDGLLFNVGGQGYLQRPDGVTALGAGSFIAANGHFAAREICDEELSCWHEIVHIVTGEVTRGSAIPSELITWGFLETTQHEDGSLAAALHPHVYPPPQGDEITIYLTLHDGRSLETSIEGSGARLLWLPGDAGLLVTTDEGLTHLRLDDGSVSANYLIDMDVLGLEQALLIRHGGLD